MGEIRIKSAEVAVYHITTRIIQRRRLLTEEAREVWVHALHRTAVFSGCEVITYCILENHAHILVRIDPATKGCDDRELVRRFEALYGDARAAWCGLDASGLAHALANDPEETAEALRARLRARMGDVSEFMRTLRQRFTKWFNLSYGTIGTIWAERFGSVVVQDIPWLVALVAAYIDLNPVRAGIAALPEDYRWSGYTEALAGNEDLQGRLAACFPRASTRREALAQYRLMMLGKGAAAKRDGSGGRVDRQALLDTIEAGGDLAVHELLQLKLRFLTQGAVLGTSVWMREGAGARLLSRPRKPLSPAPVEILDSSGLECARGRYRLGGATLPRQE